MRRKTARRIEELPGGFAVFADELPAVWDLNLVWIDTVPENVKADELAAWAERVQGAAGLAHRRDRAGARGGRRAARRRLRRPRVGALAADADGRPPLTRPAGGGRRRPGDRRGRRCAASPSGTCAPTRRISRRTSSCRSRSSRSPTSGQGPASSESRRTARSWPRSTSTRREPRPSSNRLSPTRTIGIAATQARSCSTACGEAVAVRSDARLPPAGGGRLAEGALREARLGHHRAPVRLHAASAG